MKIFKDVAGSPYELVLNMRTLTEIEAMTGLNLGLPDWGDPPLWARLTSDSILASRLIWLAVRSCETVKKNHITEANFYEDILTGTLFESAHRMFLEEYRDFFLSRSIGGMGPRLSKAVDAFLVLSSSGPKSGNSPAPSVATPAATPSDSSSA